MRNLKFFTAVDALKICVVQDEDSEIEIFNILSNYETFNFDGGSIIVNERILNAEGETKEILCRIEIDGLPYKFADVQLTSDKFSWLTISNEAFYDVLTSCNNTSSFEKIACFSILEELLPALGFALFHVTGVDICLDVNVGAVTRLRKALRNQQLVKLINGKKVVEIEALPNFNYTYQANCFKLLGQPTIYCKSTGGLELSIYDKSREIQQATPHKNEYIRRWSGINDRTMYRVELSIKANKIEKFCADNKLTQVEFLKGLLHHDFRLAVLGLVDDVLRFNPLSAASKKKSETVSVLDIVLGRYDL